MRKLLTSAGAALFVVGAAALMPNTAQAQSITPGSVPKGNNYGLVQSIDAQALQVRQANGTTQVYPLDEGVTPPENLSPGDLVVFDTNKKGVVKSIGVPEQEQVLEGTVDRIEGDQVTFLPDNGSAPVSTTVAPDTIARMGLAEGGRLRVTQYAGLGTTRVCGLPTPVVETTPEPAPSLPFGGAEPPPEPPPAVPIPALW